jgi:hypothetical protein
MTLLGEGQTKLQNPRVGLDHVTAGETMGFPLADAEMGDVLNVRAPHRIAGRSTLSILHLEPTFRLRN